MEIKVKRQRTKRALDKNLELSPGEMLLIWRRRQGWNQKQAAKHCKVSVYNFKLSEYDSLPTPILLKDPIELESHEKCLIYRKRSGKTQREIAKEIGIGRFWLRLQEKGQQPCGKLLAYWEGRCR